MSRRSERARARATKLVAKLSQVSRDPSVAPLRCPTCSAPVPLGNDDTATCGFCQTTVPVPEVLRALRTSEREHSVDREAAERLYEKLCKPPGPLLRAWVSVTGIAGGAVALVAYLVLSASAICAAL